MHMYMHMMLYTPTIYTPTIYTHYIHHIHHIPYRERSGDALFKPLNTEESAMMGGGGGGHEGRRGDVHGGGMGAVGEMGDDTQL
jgi:hypothetical protein